MQDMEYCFVCFTKFWEVGLTSRSNLNVLFGGPCMVCRLLYSAYWSWRNLHHRPCPVLGLLGRTWQKCHTPYTSPSWWCCTELQHQWKYCSCKHSERLWSSHWTGRHICGTWLSPQCSLQAHRSKCRIVCEMTAQHPSSSALVGSLNVRTRYRFNTYTAHSLGTVTVYIYTNVASIYNYI